MVESSQAQLNHMQDKLTSLFQYMRERDEAIQSYFLELLPGEVPLFPIFPRDLFQSARPTRHKTSQEHPTPHAQPTKKNVASTSTATPQTHPPVPDEPATMQVPSTPAQGLKNPASAPKSTSKAPSFARRTLTRNGKAPVKPNPPTPAPEATVELDSADDEEEMLDAPQPPAPSFDTSSLANASREKPIEISEWLIWLPRMMLHQKK
ncbi:hypothetical protein GQ457_11G027250 [Hibiscus cannabinus]